MRHAMWFCAVAAALCVASGCNDNVLGGNGDGSAGGNSDGATPITGSLAVTPSAEQTLHVTAGQMTPTATYSATWGGRPIAATWSLDRGDIGTVVAGPGTSTTFTPSGTT